MDQKEGLVWRIYRDHILHRIVLDMKMELSWTVSQFHVDAGAKKQTVAPNSDIRGIYDDFNIAICPGIDHFSHVQMCS